MKKLAISLLVLSTLAYAGIGPFPGSSGGGGGGSGTVTSVGISAPSIFSVSGSPVTTAGTLSLSYSGTALPIANGGTGATSAGAALTALGGVSGPGSSTDTALARWSSTGGTALLNSGVTLDGSNNMSGLGNLTVGSSLTVTGNISSIKGVTYIFPESQGAASSVLTNDGSGRLTWSAAAGGGVTGSGANTYVTYWTGTGTVTGTSDFIFDTINKLVTVGDTNANGVFRGGTNGNSAPTYSFKSLTNYGMSAQTNLLQFATAGSYLMGLYNNGSIKSMDVQTAITWGSDNTYDIGVYEGASYSGGNIVRPRYVHVGTGLTVDYETALTSSEIAVFSSTSKGVVFPNITSCPAAPVSGMVVLDTNNSCGVGTNKLIVYAGGAWAALH